MALLPSSFVSVEVGHVHLPTKGPRLPSAGVQIVDEAGTATPQLTMSKMVEMSVSRMIVLVL